MTTHPPIDVISFWRDVLAPAVPLLRRDTWWAWQVALKALFALPLEGDELALYRACTGREGPLAEPATDGWFIVGRRGGKSYVMALVAVFLAAAKTYELAPGERGVLMVIASDRRQARVVRRYIGALLRDVPMLAAMVEHETKESIQLNNNVDIEIHTASFRAVRGYSVVGAICDEIAFWPSDDSADPDREIIAALTPAMATTGGMLLAISSPYARHGVLYEAWRSWRGIDSHEALCWMADTATMNPGIDLAVIERAFREDAVSAWSEYGRDGEIRFRADVESFITLEAIEAATVPNRRELPPVSGVDYVGFLDFAGGSGKDSATLAIAHAERRGGQRVVLLDLVREVKPPFSPGQVCRDFAGELKRYGLRRATADRWAGDFPVEALAKHGVELKPAESVKSDLYKELLPALNSGLVELLDVPRLAAQLVGLERRVARGGRDSIDHGPRGHDDLANAAAGALVAASAPEEAPQGFLFIDDYVDLAELAALEAENERLEAELRGE